MAGVELRLKGGSDADDTDADPPRGRAANRGPRHALTCHLFSGAAMRRQHLYFIIPVLVVIAALVLFFQRDKVTEGSGAHVPPSASSGEAARPTERR